METRIPVKKRPPRLTTSDRTISVAIDNYAPIAVPVSAITLEKSPVLGYEQAKAKIFYMGHSTSSMGYDDYPQYVRKPVLKRSDTLGVHAPTMYEMKKTHSFHANDQHSPIEGTSAGASKRSGSMRHSSIYPNEFKVVDENTYNDLNRRSCKMHRSFHDSARKMERHKDVNIEVVKHHSLGEEEITVCTDMPKRKTSPKFNVSLENEVFRSRSNSRDELYSSREENDQVRKLSSESIDNKEYTFKRGAKNSQSFYLHPNSFEEMNIQRAAFYDKRQHSASMRNRQYREPLGATKKSKSFIGETRREYERSPHRRESTIFTTEDARRSPRLSSTLLVPEPLFTSDSRKSSNKDITELDYDSIVRVYQQNQRKTSMLSLEIQANKKSLDNENDECGDLNRKRKKIMCIIVTVFLSLVFASVFVVVFTLTHSVDTTVQNQTRKVYTFSRDRDMPIHYNVRQENERLMQESFNRAKFARNFTEAAPLAAGEEIP